MELSILFADYDILLGLNHFLTLILHEPGFIMLSDLLLDLVKLF